MKIIRINEDIYFDEIESGEDVFRLDHRDNPETAMILVDKVLEKFGLEVVYYEDDSDTYTFKIIKRDSK